MKRTIVTLTLTAALVAACAPLRSGSQATAPMNYELLQPQRDSFVVLSRGREIGFQVTNLERTDRGFRLEDEVRAGKTLSQSAVEFTAIGSTVRSTGAENAEGQPVRDDNLVLSLIPSLAWSRDSYYRIKTIQPDDDTPVTRTFTVTGMERVTVPSGTYDTYKVELIGEATPLVLLNVTTEKPYRLVRLVPSGRSVEFVLASTSRGPAR